MSEVTVQSCTKLKEWVKDGKPPVQIYKVDLSDGRSGESFGKDIPQGTPASDLSIETGQYGLKIKWNKAPANGKAWGGGGSKSTNESFALAYARDITIAMINKKEVLDKTPKQLVEVTCAMAEDLYNWLESKKK